MAKKRKNRQKRYQRNNRKSLYIRRTRRKTSRFAKSSALLGSPFSQDSKVVRLDDRRQWTPDRAHYALAVSGEPGRFTVLQQKKDSLHKFVNAKRVVVCKKRRRRRESLFKAGKIGKGIRGPRKIRRNENSDLRCK